MVVRYAFTRGVFLIVALVLMAAGASAQRWNWVSTGVGPSFDDVWSMSIGPSGEIFTVGVYSDSINFGGQKLTAFGNYDAFTALFTNKGRITAAIGHGGFDVDEAQSGVIDKNGNMYVAGSFVTEALVGGQLIEALSENSTDMWVAKIDKNGTLAWVKVFGSPTYDEGAPVVAVDSLGSVYVAGGVGGTGQFGTRSYTSVGKLDIFVAKLSANGDFVWVQGAGATDNDMAVSINVSPNGDRIYTASTFIGRVTFGSAGTIESFVNRADFVVQAMNNNGTTLWAKRIGYSGVDRYISTTTQSDGKLVVTGAMSQTTTFDTRTLTANGEFASDMFLCRFTKDGVIDLLERYGSTFDEVGLGVRVDTKGAFIVGGYFDSTTVIDNIAAESSGGRDGFITRIMPTLSVDWLQTMGGIYDDEIRAVGVDAKNVPIAAGVFDTRAQFGDIVVDGDRFSDVFVAALECGPSTRIWPSTDTVEVCEAQDSVVYVRSGYPAYEWYVDGAKQPETGFRYNTSKLTQGVHRIYCRMTGFDDCMNNSDTLIVSVRPGLPLPTITRSSDQLTCSVDGVLYQWYREGARISGATTKTIAINGDGNYRVLISDTTGCDRWSDNYLVGTTDVFEESTGQTVTIYPNPTLGDVTIHGAAGASVTIMDALGRVVAFMPSISDRELFTIDGAAGMYTVTLRTSGAVRTLLVTKR